jgi:hypothetical protein
MDMTVSHEVCCARHLELAIAPIGGKAARFASEMPVMMSRLLVKHTCKEQGHGQSTLCAGPEHSLQDWWVRIAVRGDTVHDEGARV